MLTKKKKKKEEKKRGQSLAELQLWSHASPVQRLLLRANFNNVQNSTARRKQNSSRVSTILCCYVQILTMCKIILYRKNEKKNLYAYQQNAQ